MRTKAVLTLFILFGVLAVSATLWGSGARPDASAGQPAADIFANLKFRNVGPSVAGGRVSAVVGIPGKPLIYYVGTAGGGVWKTTNGGNIWSAIFTKQDTASIGAIALAPSNPDLLWVGTGEANIRDDVIDGGGVYFSPDAGHSWKFMGLKDAGQISSVCVDPHDPNRVYVGVLGHAWAPNPTRGVFRTTDGGKTWKKVLFVNDSTGVASLAMQPDNPEVLFAGMWEARRYPWQMINGGMNSGIYRSTDGGDTWTKLTKGLPKPPLGRIALAVAPSNPNHVYALIASKEGMLWQSTDLGDHWTKVSDHHSLDVRPFYFSRMEVSPENEDKIFFCSLMLMESDDGGKTAHPVDRGVHVDHHAIWIDPKDPSRIAEGTDGDVYVSTDGAKTWRTFDNLPIEQFYQVAAGSDTPYTLCGGLQDNNAWCGPSSSLGGTANGADWHVVAGGDGEYAVPAPSDPSVIYADSQNADIRRLDMKTHRSTFIRPYIPGVEETIPSDLKYRFNWTSPIAVSTSNANEVYLGGNAVFKTTDGGAHWTPISPDLTRNDKSKQAVAGTPIQHDISGAETYDTILGLTLAPTDPRVIWVGTDDGLVQVTRDGGKSWTNVTSRIPGAPQWAMVSQVGVSPFNAGSAYVAFDAHELDDNRPYVYKTSDYGQSWQNISAGLPGDAPAHVVREDPNHQGLLVLGTDTGLFYSLDGGAHWLRLKSNFPTAPVFDLKFVKKSHDLVVATHGRGLFVMDDIRPLEQLTPAIESAEFHLFQSGAGVMYPRWGGTGGPEAGLSVPNAPQGVVIDYELKTAITSHAKSGAAGAASQGTPGGGAGGPTGAGRGAQGGPVKIVITDSQGRAVRTLHGPGAAGIDRVTWAMRYDGPTPYRPALPTGAAEGGFGRRGLGPRVVPGTYHVAVTAGGNTQSETVTVEADPAAGASTAGLRAQGQAALLARNEASALNEMLTRIDDVSKQLSSFASTIDSSSDQAAKTKFAALLRQGRQLSGKLEALKASVYQVHVQRDAGEDSLHYLDLLHSQVSSLPYDIEGPYGTPPNDLLREQMTNLRGQLDKALGAFNDLLKTDVASYDKAARAAGAPTVYAGSAIAVAAPASH